MDVRLGLWRKLSTEELIVLNCDVVEDSWEFLDYKEIQPVHPKGNQSWILIRSTVTEAEALILWPPDVKNWLTGKDPAAEEDWRQEEKGLAEDEMVGWYTDLMDMSWSRFRELVMYRAPAMLQSMGSQRVRHCWATELNWTEPFSVLVFFSFSNFFFF